MMSGKPEAPPASASMTCWLGDKVINSLELQAPTQPGVGWAQPCLFVVVLGNHRLGHRQSQVKAIKWLLGRSLRGALGQVERRTWVPRSYY